MKLSDNILVEPISINNASSLFRIYKEVFQGHPWHEDFVCINSKREDGDSKKCMTQYTKNLCINYDFNKNTGTTENDCRKSYQKRDTIFILSEEGSGLEKCVGCGDELRLIEFYPEFINHKDLITEAMGEKGFIGYIAHNNNPVGFSWGYEFQYKDTLTVHFSEVLELLNTRGILPEEIFYGSEVGVVNRFQNQGIGSALSALRLLKAKEKQFPFFLTRTINPYIHIMLKKMFSGKEGEFLFKDPERSSKWFKWSFSDFNVDEAEKIASTLIKY